MTVLILVASAFAQDFQPEAQVRPRMEAHTGRDAVAGGDTISVSQRTRLGMTMTEGDLTVRVVLQDVRLWGEEANTLKDFSGDAVDIPFAYAEYKPGEGNASLRFGRQQWNVHEQRLIGAVGWTQQSRSFDGLSAAFKSGNWTTDVAAAVLADSDAAAFDGNGGIAWLRTGLNPDKATAADLLYILDADATADRTRHTAGLYAKGGSGILSGRVEGYAQLGTVGDASISAWMAGVQGTVAPESDLKPRITVWYDVLSGDSDPAAGNATAFNTMFATNHKFYGLIDIADFTQGGKADGRGLQDASLQFGLAPVDGFNMNLAAHAFLPMATQGGDAVIGQEVDLTCKYVVTKQLKIVAGGAVFIPADGQTDAWSFLMLDGAL